MDNITRDLLNRGTLQRYRDELSVTGLTSNPTIFDQAIKRSPAYGAAIRKQLARSKSGEALFFDLAIEDLRRAADVFRPVHERTNGVDGWVSLEVSPLLAYDSAATLVAAKELHTRAARPNLLIKIPGTKEGLPAIEEAIFAGVPVNVTLLFSREQHLAASEAFLRGIERRIDAGLNPHVGSVASVFVSRCDVAVAGRVPAELHSRLGIAVASQVYQAYRELLISPRCQWLDTPARSPNASCGPAPATRTRTPPISCTSRPWPRRSRSIPCRKRHFRHSPTTVKSARSWRRTATAAQPCSANSPARASSWMNWRPNSSRKAPGRSWNRGTI
jgi:transaldolase